MATFHQIWRHQKKYWTRAMKAAWDASFFDAVYSRPFASVPSDPGMVAWARREGYRTGLLEEGALGPDDQVGPCPTCRHEDAPGHCAKMNITVLGPLTSCDHHETRGA